MTRLYKAPPMRKRDKRAAGGAVKNHRRKEGTGTLSLHVKRGARGYGEPYAIREDGAPLWKFKYRHPDGRGRVIAATDWQDAETKAVKKAEELDRASEERAEAPPVEAVETTRTMSALIEKFREHVNDPDAKCDARSARGYVKQVEQHIAPYFVATLKDPPVTAITSEHVDAWKRKYVPVGELKDETRRKLVSLLDRVFKVAIMHKWRTDSPVLPTHRVSVAKRGEKKGKGVGDQREGVYIEPATVSAIVTKVAELRPNDPAAPIAVLLAARCAFRREELVHLRREDVVVADDYMITWRRPVDCACRTWKADRAGRYHGKTSAATRPAVVPPELRHVLIAYLKARDAQFGAGPGWLLPAWPAGREQNHVPPGGQRLLDWAPDDLQAACAALEPKVTGLVFHDTRHPGGSFTAMVLGKISHYMGENPPVDERVYN